MYYLPSTVIRWKAEGCIEINRVGKEENTMQTREIEIIDDKFGEDCYEYEVFVEGEKRDVKYENKKIKLDDVGDDDIIEIKAKNIVLSGKYGPLLMIFYWICSIFGGSDNNAFGKPFEGYIQFKAKSCNIKLRGNKIWDKEPFYVYEGKAEVIRNNFVCTKKLRRRWFTGWVMPIDIVLILLLVLFILLATETAFGTMMAIITGIIAICCNVYAFKVLSAARKKGEM